MTQSSKSVTVGENRADRPSEYIDLVDIIAWFWKSKIWVLAGFCFGLVVAGIVTINRPLSFLVTNLPLVTTPHTPEDVMGRFNEFLLRKDFQNLFLANLDEQNRKSILLDGVNPIQLMQLNDTYVLAIRQQEADSTGTKQVEIFNALMKAVRQLSEQPTKKQPLTGSTHAEAEARFVTLTSAQAEEMAALRIQLFALENKITQKTGIQSSALMSGPTSMPLEETILKQIALSTGKLSDGERTQFVKTYSTIMGGIKKTHLKYEAPIRDLAATVVALSKQLSTQEAWGEDTPILSLDENAYKVALMKNTLIHTESKKAAFYAFSSILGALAGCMAYAIRCYLLENRKRLQAAMAHSNR